MKAPEPLECALLEWDSAFFGMRVGRISGCLTAAGASASVAVWLTDQKIDCAYYLAESGWTQSIQEAENLGFRVADLRVTLSHEDCSPAADRQAGALIRRARPGDLPALEALTRTSFRKSRFYAGGFPPDRADDMYAVWIARCCRDQTGEVWIAEGNGRLAGYVTCQADPQLRGSIGLFAVAEEARGRGLAGELLHAALDWFHQAGCRTVSVVTQGSNAGALRAYQRSGFRVCRMQVWLHWWNPERGRGGAGLSAV